MGDGLDPGLVEDRVRSARVWVTRIGRCDDDRFIAQLADERDRLAALLADARTQIAHAAANGAPTVGNVKWLFEIDACIKEGS